MNRRSFLRGFTAAAVAAVAAPVLGATNWRVWEGLKGLWSPREILTAETLDGGFVVPPQFAQEIRRMATDAWNEQGFISTQVKIPTGDFQDDAYLRNLVREQGDLQGNSGEAARSRLSSGFQQWRDRHAGNRTDVSELDRIERAAAGRDFD